MHRQVVEHDDIARLQRRHEDLLDIGEERGVVDRAIEDGRRREPVDAKAGHDGVGLPMPARRVIVEAHAAGTPPVAAQQIRGDAGFVDEDVGSGVVQRLAVLPLSAGRSDVRASLLVGVYGFF